MSDDEGIAADSSDTQYLTAEYKNGQLQIVEVTAFDKSNKESSIMSNAMTSEGSGSPKYMQVLDSDKGLVQLDLLNLTLVRCEDGEESYRLVSNSESDGGDMPTDQTVACVLRSSDGEEDQDSYVMVEGSDGPLMFLQSDLQPATITQQKGETKLALTPAEILEKAKAIQKAKAQMTQFTPKGASSRPGRKRKGDLPPPHELLSSPNFKLFLYSCKLCAFRCNAVKELTAHKASEHGSGRAKWRGGGARRGLGGPVARANDPNCHSLSPEATEHSSGSAKNRGAPSAGRGSAFSLQCAGCPFRGGTHSQLMKHVHEKHNTNKISLNTKEVEAADVLVCGACGFESSSRNTFRRHIEDQHGATTT